MSAPKAPTSRQQPPWKRKAPKKKPSASSKLTPEQKAAAKARAAKAGRPYPNLIDNMAIAKLRKTPSAKS